MMAKKTEMAVYLHKGMNNWNVGMFDDMVNDQTLERGRKRGRWRPSNADWYANIVRVSACLIYSVCLVDTKHS